jgi:uncharacterized membrane protein
MRAFARNRLAFGFILVAFAATALFYSQLPDLLPMHWDIHGQPGTFQPKWWAAWVVPVSAVLVTTSLAWLLIPKRTSTIIINTVAGFMSYLCGVTLYVAIHPSESPVPYAFMGVGLLLMVVGNILGKLTWDFFVGIRTYWTVDDPDVWERTHRVSGPVYVFGGLAILAASIAHAATPILLALLLATSLYPMIYSYIAWRRG